MRYRDLKKLKIGDRVTYNEVSGTHGTGTFDGFTNGGGKAMIWIRRDDSHDDIARNYWEIKREKP